MSFRSSFRLKRRDRVGRVKETNGGDGGRINGSGTRSVSTPPLERAKTVGTGLGQGQSTNDGALGRTGRKHKTTAY